jgi:hypothetical protein
MESKITLTIGGKTKRSNNGQHPVTIDWNALPDNAQEFVIKYGLKQYLADGMAGAESEAEAKAGVEARVAKLVSGDLSRTNAGGDKPDTETGRALKLARVAIRTQAKAKNVTLTKEQVAEAAKSWVEKNPKWLAEAKRQLAEEAKAAAAVDEDEADEIFASLIGEAEDEEDGEDGADKE